MWTATGVVTPVRANDEPAVAWGMFWEDMVRLRTLLQLHTQVPQYFRVPLWRLLPDMEQLNVYGHRFDRINTDACILGGGGVSLSGPLAGHFFRVPFPSWVVRDIRSCMARE